jgi:hypothetical protein
MPRVYLAWPAEIGGIIPDSWKMTRDRVEQLLLGSGA